MDDEIFKALNDSHRRKILDLLHEKDGLTSSEIEANFADITRFGVMKHLNVLEQSSLITCKKIGRFKYHYLNAVPLQEIADRWISRFKAPFAMTVVDLKTNLEKENAMTNKPKHVYVTIIKTTAEKLWEALTSGKITPAYYYGGAFQGEVKKGKEYNYKTPEGNLLVNGKILEATAPTKLVMSFAGHWMPGMENDAPTRVTYEIIQQGDCCRLTLIHDEFEGETATYNNTGGGWPGILSGLKTLLETGKPLDYNPMAA